MSGPRRVRTGTRTPTVSVVMPARDEGDRLLQTIESAVRGRSKERRVEIEFVVVDDASSTAIDAADVETRDGITVSVLRLEERHGVPAARNAGARNARGDVLFMTDAHVEFCDRWDEIALTYIRPQMVIAGTVKDPTSSFKGYGCRLVVPFMGTHWNRKRPRPLEEIQVAACPATVVHRELFLDIGGYDEGMRLYVAAEPEFSLRAWLAGARIVAAPDLEISHRFKPRDELNRFLEGMRPSMIHNNLRFGLLYLTERASLQMLRYYALQFPESVREAIEFVADSDVWERRKLLERELKHDFNWFVDRFDLKDQIGGEITQ